MMPIYGLTTAIQYIVADRQLRDNFHARKRFVRSRAWWAQESMGTADVRRYELLQFWTSTFPRIHIGANTPVGWERSVKGMPHDLRPVTSFGKADPSRILSFPTTGISCPFSPGSITLIRSYGLPFTITGNPDADQLYTMEDGPVDFHQQHGGARLPHQASGFVDGENMDFKSMLARLAADNWEDGFDSLGFVNEQLYMQEYRSSRVMGWHPRPNV